jgi:unsaturated chondroitin disaccharide hydrolase
MKINNKKIIARTLAISFIALGVSSCSTQLANKKVLNHAQQQTDLLLAEIPKAPNKNGTLVTPRTVEKDQLILVAARDWTSGFFPGTMWYLYELTKNEKWKKEAQVYTEKVEQEKFNGRTHDMGFKIYCSFGNGFRLTKNEKYKDIIIQSAKTLITRFNPKVGAIRSWDHNADKWDFPVIIDNMMNLELLFEATKLTGDSVYHKIAVTHANTTLKNHFRPDYSSFHVISYNPTTGAVEKKNTHQGYAHESAWARGQAWAIYGYTLCYRETKDPKYLEQAQNIANFLFTNKNMPEDLVPYWDFDVPNIEKEPRDVSAATIIASSLYELSTYSKHKEDYLKKANKIMASVGKKYSSDLGTNKGFILDHSTGHKPSNGEIDVPLNYADYYYMEALVRAKRLKDRQAVVQ